MNKKKTFIHFSETCIKINDIIGVTFIDDKTRVPYYTIYLTHGAIDCKLEYFSKFVKPYLINDKFINVSNLLFVKKSYVTAVHKYSVGINYELILDFHHIFIPEKQGEELIRKLCDN